MPRLLFEKTSEAIWISHLDLMRLFQRAFKRAGLKLKHTQGFNPRPSVSIALPMSVGVHSHCELLDFDLEGEFPDNETIRERLNLALIDGVRVLQVYDQGAKLRDLFFLECRIDLEYDCGVPESALDGIKDLLAKDTLVVPKKTKSGLVDQNIADMIKQHSVRILNEQQVRICATICCQNPTLNPAQIVSAIELYAPQWKPDHSVVTRLEIMNSKNELFR